MRIVVLLLCAVFCAWANGEEPGPAAVDTKEVTVEKEKTGVWVQVAGERKWYSNEQIIDRFAEQAKHGDDKEELLRRREQTIADLKVVVNEMRDRMLNMQAELRKSQDAAQALVARNEELTRELNRLREQLPKKD
jgi:hypothetical protein